MQKRRATDTEPFQEKQKKKKKESTAALSYCAFWTKGTMRPARQSFGERKKIIITLCFPTSFPLNVPVPRLFSCREVSVSGNNQDPGGSARREGSGAKRSNKAHGRFPSAEVRRIKEVEEREIKIKKIKTSRAQLKLCVLSKKVSRRPWAHSSLSPSVSKKLTNSHSSSEWLLLLLPACLPARAARILPLPDFQADSDPASVALLQRINTLVCLGFRKAVAEGARRSFAYMARKRRDSSAPKQSNGSMQTREGRKIKEEELKRKGAQKKTQQEETQNRWRERERRSQAGRKQRGKKQPAGSF
ncbi:uncharacterized protein LOC108166880 [Poecilia reticulata]|uniref:uncharacterized protein LOC108166880 n=1 Tax=Poecilia reticulata TaxID=8081 RepID=UPI0007EAB36A|nr:PREDICTED: uncharacterized protein LOC108166880 [Poecilia reticulata]